MKVEQKKKKHMKRQSGGDDEERVRFQENCVIANILLCVPAEGR